MSTGPVDGGIHATLATDVGNFAARTSFADMPEEVVVRAKHLVLDAVGLAFASTHYRFPWIALDALRRFGSGSHPVLGMSARLQPRDAAVLNGVLIHGLDFDDTHMSAVTHVSAGALPAALSSAVLNSHTARELLVAYVLGVEISARVGIGGAGGFHDVGFHPTGVAGGFGAAVTASRLAGLDAAGIATAQGIVGSMAAGLLEFLDDGSWTKRLHPGWAAASGITAASFAAAGWSGPPAVYEGRFGLYASHLSGRTVQPESVAEGLGRNWELMRTAVKPYPVCHFNHAFADAAVHLRNERGVHAEDIESIRCAIHPVPGKVVSEPVENKLNPRDEYDARFSLPFVVASCFLRGRFTLAELDDSALRDPEILALARTVQVVAEDESAFPDAYSGAVEVVLRDGRRVAHREQVNRGHEQRPLSNEEIVEKFFDNTALVISMEAAQGVRDAVMCLDGDAPATDIAEACRAGD